MEQELWQPIPVAPEYEVSNLGRVRHGEKVLRPGVTAGGYYKVCLGRRWQCYIHRLVVKAFHGPAPNGERCVDHLDHDKLNNHWKNLEWVTDSENHIRTYRSGRHGQRKLSKQDVETIKALHGKVPAPQLAERFGIARSYLCTIQTGKYVHKAL